MNMSEDTETQTAQTSEQPISFDKIVDERGVPLGNVLKEVTRKLGRMNEMNAKLDMLLQTQPTQSPDKGTAEANFKIDATTKKYVDARLDEITSAGIEQAQQAALDQVFKTFPELSKSSEEFDTEFFNLAVKYENSMDRKDPDRPLKAAKLAALDLGKIERITKAKVIQDEARRTRMLSEGTAPSKEGSKKSNAGQMTMNKSMVSKWLKVDPTKVEKFAKEEE